MSETEQTERAARSSAGPHIPLALAPIDHGADSTPEATSADCANESQSDASFRRIDSPHDHLGTQEPPAQTAADNVVAAMTAPRRDRDVLLQATQITDYLRSQFAELDRRESRLNQQLVLSDRERRRIRLSVQQFEQDKLEQDQAIEEREAELARQSAECEALVNETVQRQQELDDAARQLAAERGRLNEELGREIAAERVDLDRERAEWASSRQAASAELERERQEHRSACQAECEQTDAEIATARAEWAAELQAERSRSRQEREQHEEALRAGEKQLQDSRTEFQQQQATFENRMRFQQDHLAKSRSEFEQQQRVFQSEYQQGRSELVVQQEMIRRIAGQFDERCRLLDEREASIQREHALLIEAKRSFEAETDNERECIAAERRAWEEERTGQQAEVRRQQDMLARHAEKLEGRRARLDLLRSELEKTHRSNLEMRMAVEETWAQLTQTSGVEAATDRIEATRRLLSDHYRQHKEELGQQQSELNETRVQLHKEWDEFRTERQVATGLIAARDRALREWEQRITRHAVELDQRETAWKHTRDRWVQEKLQAEHIIRDLLKQLSDQGESTPEPAQGNPQPGSGSQPIETSRPGR